jgi:hypothetical protein
MQIRRDVAGFSCALLTAWSCWACGGGDADCACEGAGHSAGAAGTGGNPTVRLETDGDTTAAALADEVAEVRIFATNEAGRISDATVKVTGGRDGSLWVDCRFNTEGSLAEPTPNLTVATGGWDGTSVDNFAVISNVNVLGAFQRSMEHDGSLNESRLTMSVHLGIGDPSYPDYYFAFDDIADPPVRSSCGINVTTFGGGWLTGSIDCTDLVALEAALDALESGEPVPKADVTLTFDCPLVLDDSGIG